MREDDPAFGPTRPVLAAYTRQPFDISTEVPLITDPLTHRVAEVATVAYELVLQSLTRFFTHTDETDEQLQLPIGTSIGLMAAVVRSLGTAMTKLPVGLEHEGRTAGLAFEMYYLMSNFVPWRPAAWALLHERTVFLRDACRSLAEVDGAPSVIVKAAQEVDSMAVRIAEHIPPALRDAVGGSGRGPSH
jgi:hypothetical protein